MKTAKQLTQSKKALTADIQDVFKEHLKRISKILKGKLKKDDMIQIDGPSVPSDFDEQVDLTVTGVVANGQFIEIHDGLNEPECIKLKDCSDDVLIGIVKELEKIKVAKDVVVEKENTENNIEV